MITTRGGIFGVDALKAGVGVIVNAVKVATGQLDQSSIFGVFTNGYQAFQKWRLMWDEVRELDWADALELGKYVATELLPFIGGIFGIRGVGADAEFLRSLEPYQATRNVEGLSDQDLVKLGNIVYAQVFPNFCGIKGEVA